jgi:hypothetical protein
VVLSFLKKKKKKELVGKKPRLTTVITKSNKPPNTGLHIAKCEVNEANNNMASVEILVSLTNSFLNLFTWIHESPRVVEF